MMVVDASVAIKVALNEPDSPIAVAALRAHMWSAPDVFMSECANIIWKRRKIGDITREQALQALEIIEALNIYIEPGRMLIDRAVNLALDLDHPAYDCFYIAHAERERAPLLTADNKLIAKVRASSATDVAIINLQDYARANDLPLTQ